MPAKTAKAPALKNWDEAVAVLDAFREARCALDKKQAALEDALRKVQESYQLEIDPLKAELKQHAAALQKFAEAQKADFKAKEDGGKGRTRVLHQVEIGWRWGKPYVQIPKKFEEAAIKGLEAIAEDTYVRRPPQIMRDVLKAELLKAKEKGGEDEEAVAFIGCLAALRITLDQDEEFVLEVVKTE